MEGRERHPWVLKWFFSIEMWERFGFYLMLGILSLFLIDTEFGGFGYTKGYAAEIYGTFYALCYLTPFIGGMIAERLIAFRFELCDCGSGLHGFVMSQDDVCLMDTPVASLYDGCAQVDAGMQAGYINQLNAFFLLKSMVVAKLPGSPAEKFQPNEQLAC